MEVHTETGGWEKDGFLQILIYRVPIVPISLFQILNRIPEQETMVSFLNLWDQHLHELLLLYVNDTVENHVHLRADWNRIRNETEDIGEIVKRRENTNVCCSDCEENASDDPPSFELRLILRLILINNMADGYYRITTLLSKLTYLLNSDYPRKTEGFQGQSRARWSQPFQPAQMMPWAFEWGYLQLTRRSHIQLSNFIAKSNHPRTTGRNDGC